jgi:hypothetical protein
VSLEPNLLELQLDRAARFIDNLDISFEYPHLMQRCGYDYKLAMFLEFSSW